MRRELVTEKLKNHPIEKDSDSHAKSNSLSRSTTKSPIRKSSPLRRSSRYPLVRKGAVKTKPVDEGAEKHLDHIFIPEPLEQIQKGAQFNVEYYEEDQEPEKLAYRERLSTPVQDVSEKTVNTDNPNSKTVLLEKVVTEELADTIASVVHECQFAARKSKDVNNETISEISDSSEHSRSCLESNGEAIENRNKRVDVSHGSDSSVTPSSNLSENKLLDQEHNAREDFDAHPSKFVQSEPSEVAILEDNPGQDDCEPVVVQYFFEDSDIVNNGIKKAQEIALGEDNYSDGSADASFSSCSASSSSGAVNTNIFKFEDVFGNEEISKEEDSEREDTENESSPNREPIQSPDGSRFSADSLVTGSQDFILRQYDSLNNVEHKDAGGEIVSGESIKTDSVDEESDVPLSASNIIDETGEIEVVETDQLLSNDEMAVTSNAENSANQSCIVKNNDDGGDDDDYSSEFESMTTNDSLSRRNTVDTDSKKISEFAEDNQVTTLEEVSEDNRNDSCDELSSVEYDSSKGKFIDDNSEVESIKTYSDDFET